MKTVTTRIPEDDEAALAELEEELSADRSEVLRRLIRQGLADWRKERALEDLRDHSITLRTAAERADVPYVEMLTLAAEEGIDVGYTTEDLERDLERI
jgi:predicted HTH domain antitoxin